MEGMVKKTVVVTGGAGFIGAHLVELLLKKRYSVVVIDIQKSAKTYFFNKFLDKKTRYEILDIRKRTTVNKFFSSLHPNFVIHLAAQPIVQDAYNNPYNVFETNIMGTVNILEACRKLKGLEGVIVASSDKAYGKTTKEYTEESSLNGDHPYDVSKSATDLIAQTYAKTYGMPVIITRFGNVYGEGDLHFDRIVPGICKSIITKKPLQIRSDGTYIRDYVYVKDVAMGYYFLMKLSNRLKGQAYNFSSKDTWSVLTLLKKTSQVLKKDIKYLINNTAKNEIQYQHLNDSKIRKIGWKEKHTFISVMPGIYRWYKKAIEQ